ncbi:MAG: sigma-70 family RNA polymerase sigma factor [Ruminococcaceae bacterium]|nr:sigma-70 family RNA polymerase sigma factor [Oscillospiraceae bacterium]
MWAWIKNIKQRLTSWLRGKREEDGDIFYINGPDTLPLPLTHEDEAAAIERLGVDEDAKTLLVEHNLRLVVYIAKRFESTGIGLEDLISIGTIGLIKSVNTFRADKNIKLATYASRCIENEILMYIRKNSGQRHEVSIDEPLNTDWDGNELLLSDVLSSDEVDVVTEIAEREERQAIRDCVAKLEERERVIIELRYGLSGGEEMTQKEVADLLGISQSYISRLEKKIIAKLREELKQVL